MCYKMSGKVLRIHPRDNVAVTLCNLSPGARVEIEGQDITLTNFIPCGHKFSLWSIPENGRIIKYGQPIGRASRLILPGEHVHVHNVVSGRRYGDTAQPSDVVKVGVEEWSLPPLEAKFFGYRRPNGRVGVRNHVLVLATVHCVNGIVERIGRAVPDVVALPHVYGCSQLGKDLAQTRRILEAYAAHPNVGAVLLVGLGCEAMPTKQMTERLKESGVFAELLMVQDTGGSRVAVERGAGIARELVQEVQKVQREPLPISELVVGVECGGSDAWSGITANPAVGVVSDTLVRLGGTVILSEVTEFIGAELLLAARAVSAQVARQLLKAVSRREAAARKMQVELRGVQPSPGNIEGGLTTIEEKSLGAIIKGGTTPIQEVVGYGLAPKRRGLVVMDTAGNDLESVTAMVAGGAQIILFTTGRGSPVGNPIAPVIKIASNSWTYNHLRDDIDLNAGTVLDGESLSDVGIRILKFLLEVANGELTVAEGWGHREFAIESLGPRI